MQFLVQISRDVHITNIILSKVLKMGVHENNVRTQREVTKKFTLTYKGQEQEVSNPIFNGFSEYVILELPQSDIFSFDFYCNLVNATKIVIETSRGLKRKIWNIAKVFIKR